MPAVRVIAVAAVMLYWRFLGTCSAPKVMEALHNSSSNRSRPLGDTEGIIETAMNMGLESTLRKRGRPKRPNRFHFPE